jgi:predicted phosphodiesterase
VARDSTGKQLAIKLCDEHPTAPSKSLAKRLYDENVELFPSFDAAYCCVRRVRGNAGKRNRDKMNATPHYRENGKCGWVPECPPSHAEPWLPFDLPGPASIGVLSDIHVPYHDHRAVTKAVEFLKEKHKLTHLLLNGDFMDFYQLSRWEKNPKARDLVCEIESGRATLSWLRGQFPDAEMIYKLGNHDERLDKYIWNKAPELLGLNNVQIAHVLEFEKFGITEVRDQRPIMAGKLPIFHGHELPRGMSSPVNPARGAYMRTAHTMLMGHLHRPSTHTEPDMFKNDTTCWSTGCLCDMTPEYARLNKWSHGFCFVEVASDGTFGVHNYQITRDGSVRPA